MTTINTADLDRVTGGGAKAKVLQKMMKEFGGEGLPQLGDQAKKVWKFLGGGKIKAPKGNAIAEGDFGASPSNFISIRGD